MATSCCHRPSKTTIKIDKNVTIITKQFILESNWSDFGAVVKLAPTTVHLHTLFPKDKGPNVYPFFASGSKGFGDAAEKAAEAINKRRQAHAAIASPAASSPAQEARFMEETTKAKGEEVAKKASKQLKELKSKRDALKQVSLS